MKKIFSYTALVILLAAVSCTGRFEEYNTNPETPREGETDPVTLIEELICSSASDLQYRSWWCHDEIMQYTVDVGNSTRFHLYTFPASAYETFWNTFYIYASNAQEVVTLAQNYNDPNMQAIGMTLKTMYFSILTDMYGDIPYSEALRIKEGIVQPKMDRQQEVYEGMIQTLLDANKLYDAKKSILVPEKDLLYGGDIAKWKKFTNSLCLRLCLRLSNRPGSLGLTTLKTIVDSPATYPIFSSVADDAKIAFTMQAPFRGPFGGMADNTFTTSSRKCSERFVDALYSTSDPRRSVWTVPVGDEIKGVQSGYKNPDGAGCATLNVATLKPYNAPAWFLTTSEVKFILSEAALQGYIAGGTAAARKYYEDAIRMSITQWVPQATQADIDKFLLGEQIQYAGTVEQIIGQKWLSLFMQGFESWNDYRRTGFPRLAIGPDNVNEGILPTRMIYGQTTVATNRANYDAEVAYLRATYPIVSPGSMGGDNMKTPVWWSKRAVELESGN